MKTTEENLADVLQYFQDNGIDTSNSQLDLEQLADVNSLTVGEITILCCNLEDTDTMQELVNNDYDTFDPWDEAQFNDGYWDVVDDLGLCHDDGEDEDLDYLNDQDSTHYFPNSED